MSASGFPRVVSHYTLDNIIGQGAYGKVYSGRNNKTFQKVALKEFEVKEETDEIARERKILESLPPHPHIVRLFDVFWEELGAKGNRLYFAMEYMELGTIVSVLEKVRGVEEGSTSSGKEIPEVLLKYATLQILEGLTHLHSHHIIHRDLKGLNVLVNEEGSIKLSDFGVSGLNEEFQKRFTVIGSPYWMAPEMIEMSGHDLSSDIWSLGCVVVELLTGKPPYFDLDPMAAMFNIVESGGVVPDGVGPELANFLGSCFIKKPPARPTAKDLHKHKWLADAPTTITPELSEIFSSSGVKLRNTTAIKGIPLNNLTPLPSPHNSPLPLPSETSSPRTKGKRRGGGSRSAPTFLSPSSKRFSVEFKRVIKGMAICKCEVLQSNKGEALPGIQTFSVTLSVPEECVLAEFLASFCRQEKVKRLQGGVEGSEGVVMIWFKEAKGKGKGVVLAEDEMVIQRLKGIAAGGGGRVELIVTPK